MELSQSSVELLIDLVENKLSDMDIDDNADMIAFERLIACRRELAGHTVSLPSNMLPPNVRRARSRAQTDAELIKRFLSHHGIVKLKQRVTGSRWS